MKKTKRESRGGFTLLEAMVATGVFAVGTLGSFGLMSWIVQATSYSERLVDASAVGQGQIEALAEMGYDDVASGTTNHSPYGMVWTVNPDAGFKKVTLDVKWYHHSGHSRELRVSTLVADEIQIAALPDSATPGSGGTTATTSP
jgi:type II secretory pathway component PulJ